MKTISNHLLEQAERYARLARQLDVRGDGQFLLGMAEGYLAQAERVAMTIAEHDADQPALYANYMRKPAIALE